MLCIIYACLKVLVKCLQLVAFHLFMSCSVDVSTIFQNVLAVAETLTLRHVCRQ